MNTLDSLPPERQRLLNRSTDGFSPLAYLNIIERGSTEEWALLYNACRDDQETRLTVIELLPMADPIQAGIIQLWSDLLARLGRLKDPEKTGTTHQ